jgi:hypothetical protein
VLTSDRDLAAVVAHGLLNSLAALVASAATLLRLGARLKAEDEEELVEMIIAQSVVFIDGLHLLLQHCSDPFADAATTVALVPRAISRLSSDERHDVLEGLLAGSKVLEQGLHALVRGLPPDVVSLLDGLQPK